MAKEPVIPAPPPTSGDASVTDGKRGRRTALLLIAGLMGIEGVGIFFVTRTFFGAEPLSVQAGEVDGRLPPPDFNGEDDLTRGDRPGRDANAGGSAPAGVAEVEIAECRPNNRMSGKLISFKLRVSALVAASKAERARQLVEANSARIHDRVNGVIRSADPRDLNEPGLEGIKRRLQAELARVLGDEQLIQEVLVPELLQSGSGL